MSEYPRPPIAIKYGTLPPLGLPVQVQCDGFKCMAYLDKAGRWKDFFTHEFMTHVLGVVAPD